MTLPTGAPSAVTSKKTLTVAIVSRIGWIRVDSEDASVELLEGRGRVKPAERPRLASKLEIRPHGKIDRKSRWLEGWSEEAGAEQYSRSGAQGGARMLSWKIHTRITFAFEQCIKCNFSSTFRLSPPVAKPKMYLSFKNCLGTSLPHHDLASPVETEHAAMAGLPTPTSRKISDFRKRQHTTVFSGQASGKA